MNQTSKGFTLTELMVSIALGVVLIAGVIEVYTGSKQTYRTQEALAHMQENARLALEILSRDIRMSGNVGCENLSNVAPAQNVLGAMGYNSSFALWGTQSDGSNHNTDLDNLEIRTAVTPLVVDNSDILVVQSAGRCSMPLTADMAADDQPITTADNLCDFSAGELALVSNCSSSGLFRVNGVAGGVLTPAASVGSAFRASDGAEVLTFSSNTYFVAPDRRGPALFMMDNTRQPLTPVALVEGVESLQVEYGLDTDATPDGIPNRYVNADQAGDFTTVAAVRITLLLTTLVSLGAQETEFDAGGTATTYDAGPIRKEFVTTIGLRNI